MTRGKVLARLVEWQPVIFKAAPLVASRCILATAVGHHALKAFGIESRPISVKVDLANSILVQWHRDGEPGGLEEAKARGGWLLSAGYRPDEMPPNTVLRNQYGKNGWDGHLALGVTVDGQDLLIDLDLQQFNRPAKGILVADAGVFPWKPDGGEYNLPGGHQISYQPSPSNTSWQDAADWALVDRRAGLVAAVVRAIRKGRL